MRGDDEPGVELAHFRQHGCGVRFTCRDCKRHHDVDLEVVIARLQARGVGGAHTGIRTVARLAEKPCERCGATRFETTPAWPSGEERRRRAARSVPGGG